MFERYCAPLLIFLFSFHSLYSKEIIKPEFPHYKIDVSYDHDKTLLKGKMQVSFSRNLYPTNELLFSLPGNRFRFPDDRGTRKHKIVPVFSVRRFRDNLEDPKLPKGFNHGSMVIHSVSIFKKEPLSEKKSLDYFLEENTDLEIGYSINQGLLRISLPKILSDYNFQVEKSTIEIEFSTKFPEHSFDGSTNGMLLTSNWHPKLLNRGFDKFKNEIDWDTKGNRPSPGTFEVKFKAIQSGTLITTPGYFQLSDGQIINIPMIKKPIKSFPLVFSKLYKKLISKNENFEKKSLYESSEGPKLISFYFDGQKRRAQLLLNWSISFLKFLRTRYGLNSPWRTISIVPVEAEYEQVEVINNLVLVPLPNYKRSKLMDRQALGFLTRRFAQLWFGESLWNDQDKQLWVNLGIPAFLGLRYFQHKFGSEAGIFDTIDWLNPRYRDHYYESMVNSIPLKMRYPILSSFRKNPDSQNFLRTLTYKTALVISMLEHTLGDRVFQRGLQYFSREYYQKIVGKKEFQLAFEKFNFKPLRNPMLNGIAAYKEEGWGSLDWFFSQWFETVKSLDYSFEESTTRKLSSGIFLTEVRVKKIGDAKMPIEISLTGKDGTEIRKILDGSDIQENVIFQTKSFPDKVSIDPDEKLLETSRINNHSFNFYRVRFGFDWKKQRENLVLVVPGFGNNALDGNSIGFGIRYSFDNYRIFGIPGYGTKNKRFLYILNLDRKNLVLQGMEAGFSFYEYGGVRSQGLRATFNPPQNPGDLEYKLHTRFSRETLFNSRSTSEYGESEIGESNSFLLEYSGKFSANNFYEISWNIWNEQPTLELASDFSYVRGQGTIEQVFRIGHRKSIELELIRSKTTGISPIQKKFQLGGPDVLRGYPQQTVLSDDHLLASRLDFKFPLINSPFWGNISTFKIQGAVFFDQGKIWSDEIPFENVKHRKSVGMGVEWTVDTISLFQIPLKFEVAFPQNDEDYKKPQFIFLGVLTGS